MVFSLLNLTKVKGQEKGCYILEYSRGCDFSVDGNGKIHMSGSRHEFSDLAKCKDYRSKWAVAYSVPGSWAHKNCVSEIKYDCVTCELVEERSGNAKKESSINKELEAKLNQSLTNKEILKWYEGLTNPLNKDNIKSALLQWLSLQPNNPYLSAALSNLGTAAGAFAVGMAYINLFETASKEAIDKLAGIMKTNQYSYSDFSRTTSMYLLSRPNNLYAPEDAALIITGLGISNSYLQNRTEDEAVVKKSLTYAAIGFVLAETGEKKISERFLEASISSIVSNNNIRSEDIQIVEEIISNYSLNVANAAELKKINTAATSPSMNLTGLWECYGTNCLPTGTREVQYGIRETVNPIEIVQNSDLIRIKTYYRREQTISITQGVMTMSPSTMTMTSEGEGRIINSIIIVPLNNNTKTTSQTMTLDIMGKKENTFIQPIDVTNNSTLTMTIINIDEIKMESRSPEGLTSIYTIKRIK
jgi:hypothetical protein